MTVFTIRWRLLNQQGGNACYTPAHRHSTLRVEESDMRPEAMDRWTTVKRIHQCALDKAPSEREAFVRESSGGDQTVLREVQSLLAYQADAESFLERPALEIAPGPASDPHEDT